MPTVLHYTSLQSIRQMANLQRLKKLESLTGAANGSNRVFAMSKFPVVDSNYDDITDATDIAVTINGVPLASSGITSIDAVDGNITLVTPPANGALVQCTYYYSPINDSMIAGLRTQAEGWLNRRVRNIIDITLLDASSFPADWATIVQFRAAGVALVNDYGQSADTDLSSKDGYLKMNTARDMLAEYISDVMTQSDPDDTDPQQVSSASLGHIFGPTRPRFTGDDRFFNSDGSFDVSGYLGSFDPDSLPGEIIVGI